MSKRITIDEVSSGYIVRVEADKDKPSAYSYHAFESVENLAEFIEIELMGGLMHSLKKKGEHNEI